MSTSAQLKPSEVLAKAADLIEPEGAWTQGALARSASGYPVEEDAPEAVCWCGKGAVWRTAEDFGAEIRMCDRLDEEAEDKDFAKWNDALGRTQAEVVAALRKASELAKAEGQ